MQDEDIVHPPWREKPHVWENGLVIPPPEEPIMVKDILSLSSAASFEEENEQTKPLPCAAQRHATLEERTSMESRCPWSKARHLRLIRCLLPSIQKSLLYP